AEPTPQTHSFGIYLVPGPVDGRLTVYAKGDWSMLPLLSEPIISDQDLVSYDWNSHTMRLKDGSPPRTLGLVPVDGIPFVVVANGEKIYFGAFVTTISSKSFAVPTITVHVQESPSLTIDRAYPDPSFGVGGDPRGDNRIRKALETAGKLDRTASKTSPREPTDRGALVHLAVNSNDVVRVAKPGVGMGLIKITEFGKEALKYRWRFNPLNGAPEMSGETTLSNSPSGPAALTLGKLRLGWSGGETNGWVYYHAFREKVEVLKPEAFESAL
ncbi:MAG TPA: hypothetical protein VN673_05620, partial [Clostridia bacterium]|nr:hypothetical protein [Clostridia bacterium]